MEKQKEKQAGQISWRAFFRFIKNGKFSWTFIVLAIVLGLGSSTVLSMIPDATGQIYAGDFSMSTLGAFFFLTVVSFLISACTNLMTIFAKARSTRGVRGVVWNKMLGMNASSKESQSADTLFTSITSDTRLAVNYIIEALVLVPSSVYLIVVVLAMAAMMNVKLLLVMFVLVPVYIIYGIFVGRWQEKTNYRMQMRIGKLTGYLSERLYNLDLVKAYTNETEETENGKDAAEKLYRANLQSTYIGATTTAYVLLTDVVASIIGIAWGSYLLRNGEIDVQAWMSFFVMIPMINEQMRYLVQLWVSAKGVLGYSQRLVSIMEAPFETKEGEAVEEMGDISFENISFAYDEKKVMDNVSFEIPKSKFTAVVGTSGSGKTTMLNLIERLYQPAEGLITMGGKDIQGLDLSEYRSNIAYIQQDAGIFSGTIREAVCYGLKYTASEEEITEALKKSGIYEDVMKSPEGLDLKVSLWGESLSGGQRQKLVIARAILYKAELILLDEPTSALDCAATEEMHDMIHQVFEQKTVVAVTHDLAFAQDADQIIVMDRGAVVSSGTHGELMQNCSFYKEMIEAQKCGEV